MNSLTIRRVLLFLPLLMLLSACTMLKSSSDSKATATPALDTPLDTRWRLGLVTNIQGTVHDGGFNESAHVGAQRAAAEFHLDYTYAESRDENDYYLQLDRQITDGRNIIVTVGFPMEAVTLEYAQKHPDIYFIGVDQSYSGQEIPANLIGLQFTEDEAAFMVGALAGQMTKSNVVGVIGGMEIPPVVRLAEGFRNGAQYVNPDVTVLITYTGDFNSPDLGISTADTFIQQKADVIFGAAGSTGYAGIQYAARQGVWVIGVDQDEWRTNFREGTVDGSDRILTSAIKQIDSAVYQAIDSIVSGSPRSGIFLLNTAGCGVGYAPFHQADSSIPAADKTMIETIWRALAAGTLQTGASDSSTTAPAPLAPGAKPDVPADAPFPSDCES
jgi:basic membrane protein A and related proteins